MYAAKLCISNMDLTRVLLNYGQSPGVEEKDIEEGNTPLHWAVVGNVQSPYALSPILRVSGSCWSWVIRGLRLHPAGRATDHFLACGW